MVPASHSIAVASILLVFITGSGCRAAKVAGSSAASLEHPSLARANRAAYPSSRQDSSEPAITNSKSDIRQTAAEIPVAPDDVDPAVDHESITASSAVNALFDETQAIDLTTALLLTTGGNPQVAFAQARIDESLAQVERADVLWLPTVRMGANINKHQGTIQDVAGNIITTDRNSYFTGLGSNAVGAGSPTIPGLLAQFHIADAVFQPRIARQTAAARQSGAQAVTNDALLQTALAYVTLLRAAQELAVAIDIEDKAKELERVTGEFARTGQGLESDHDRARTELALRNNDVRRSEEAVGVASARLAEQIRWNSSHRLLPTESQLAPIDLVPPGLLPQEMVATALTHRPEIAESRHLVCEAVERLQRERYAPLVPSVLLGFSYGGLGGGLNGAFPTSGSRLDADAIAYWEVRQMGFGEQAARREADSRIQQSRFRDIALMDRIAREVVEAQIQVASRAQQIETGRSAIKAAEDSYSRNLERIKNGQGLPLEVLQSIQALGAAQRDYVRVIADYNTAQFTLHRSLGWPIQ